MPKRNPRRIQPLTAYRALQALLANPDDTNQVFRLLRALSGNSFGRLFAKVGEDPVGARIIAEKRSLLPVLNDRDALRSLPAGSLGAEYLAFIEAEQISADGLVDASNEDGGEFDAATFSEEAVAFGERLRDMHDLWHVVTGYSRDILGELALLAFTHQQTRELGIWVIVYAARRRIRKGGNREVDAFLAEGARRGKNAALLPAADWEALLSQPLTQVREELNVGPLIPYVEHRSQAGERAAQAPAT